MAPQQEIDRASRRLADRLLENPSAWTSKEKLTALIAIELREVAEALEERDPLTAMVIFGGSLAAGLVLGFVWGAGFGWPS